MTMAASRAYLTFNPELEVLSSLDSKTVTEDGDVSIDTTPEMALQNEWKIWEQLENDTTQSGNYKDSTKPIGGFSTVQEFWQLWNMLPQPSQLMNDKRMVRSGAEGRTQMVDAIMIFRSGVKPMWEDELNANGGHFEIRYAQTKDPDEQGRLDEHWNNIVLGMVGATIEPVGMITGVRLVDKLHTNGRSGGVIRFEIWFTDQLGVPDGRNVLKSNLEKAMTTKLDGSRDSFRLQFQLKPHYRK